MTSIKRGVKKYLANKQLSNRGYIPPIMSLITKERTIMSKSELLLAPDNIDTVSTLLLIEINPFYKELKAMTQLDNFNESSLPLPTPYTVLELMDKNKDLLNRVMTVWQYLVLQLDDKPSFGNYSYSNALIIANFGSLSIFAPQTKCLIKVVIDQLNPDDAVKVKRVGVIRKFVDWVGLHTKTIRRAISAHYRNTTLPNIRSEHVIKTLKGYTITHPVHGDVLLSTTIFERVAESIRDINQKLLTTGRLGYDSLELLLIRLVAALDGYRLVADRLKPHEVYLADVMRYINYRLQELDLRLKCLPEKIDSPKWVDIVQTYRDAFPLIRVNNSSRFERK